MRVLLIINVIKIICIIICSIISFLIGLLPLCRKNSYDQYVDDIAQLEWIKNRNLR